jgi:uncharacterized C2H2 Zn-finger protein
MKQTHAYAVDLTKMQGEGGFSCPKCGAVISPDDCDEEAYSILEIKVNDQDLYEVVIRCNRCMSQINLTGFSLLKELS